MTEHVTTFCDGCNPRQTASFSYELVDTWVDRSAEYCVELLGWSEEDGEHYCPTCTKKRKTNARKGSRYAPIPHLPAQGTGETRGLQNG